MLIYEIVTQLSTEGCLLPCICQIESSCLQDRRFLPEAQSSILNSPTRGWIVPCSLPPFAPRNKGLLLHMICSHRPPPSPAGAEFERLAFLHVRRLDFVPELIMASCLQAPARLSFLSLVLSCVFSLLTAKRRVSMVDGWTDVAVELFAWEVHHISPCLLAPVRRECWRSTAFTGDLL